MNPYVEAGYLVVVVALAGYSGHLAFRRWRLKRQLAALRVRSDDDPRREFERDRS
jgi:hypothetical protein